MRKEPSVRWCWKHILQRGVHFIPEGTGLDSTLGSINLHARLPKTGFGKPSSKWRDSLWSLQGGTQWLFFFLFSYFAKVRVPLGLLPVSIHSSFHHLPLVPFLCARHFGSLLSILNYLWVSLSVLPSLNSSPGQAGVEEKRGKNLLFTRCLDLPSLNRICINTSWYTISSVINIAWLYNIFKIKSFLIFFKLTLLTMRSYLSKPTAICEVHVFNSKKHR